MRYKANARRWKGLILSALLAGPAAAEGERAGVFDYYVAALSWSASWCALTGDARGDPQCAAGQGIAFVLHGLWPQFEAGWPSYCRTGERDPSRAETAAVADVFGGAGAAFYQWKKHGRCAGLPARDYFALAREVRARIRIPEVLTRIDRQLALPASVIEDAFIEANPGLSPAMVTVTCEAGMIDEVRICLGRDLSPRPCAPDAARDCRATDAVLPPVR